jgi:hypothetical protein
MSRRVHSSLEQFFDKARKSGSHLTLRWREMDSNHWYPEREACFFGTLKFNGGILFSLTLAVPRQTLRWQLEYEVHF